jgi:hypothetical protein
VKIRGGRSYMTRNYNDKEDGNGQSWRGATWEPWLKR